jgi:hypothetical protein
MADTTPSDVEQEAKQQDEAIRLRRQISNGYAALLGTQTAKDFSRYTFEEALGQQIERIEGASTALRPNLLDRVERIKNELVSAVTQIKQMPPESFREPEEDDVNKPMDEEEQAEYDAWLAQTLAEREQAEE